jgi:hypothetical protein
VVRTDLLAQLHTEPALRGHRQGTRWFARSRGPHRGQHAIAGIARIAHPAWLNHAPFARHLGGEWAGQGSDLRPWD